MSKSTSELVYELEKRFPELPDRRFNLEAIFWSIAAILVALLADLLFLSLFVCLAFLFFYIGLLGVRLFAAAFLFSLLYVRLQALTRYSKIEHYETIDRELAPALYDEVERIAKQTESPVPDQIYWSAWRNAAISTHHPLWLERGGKHHLVVGILTMELMQKNNFSGVIAHELHHFKTVYQVERILLAALIAAHNVEFNLRIKLRMRLIFSLRRRLQAILTIIHRKNEEEADQASASIIGASPEAVNNLRFGVIDRFLDNHCKLYQGSTYLEHDEPPKDWSRKVTSETKQFFEHDDNLRTAIEQLEKEIHSFVHFHPTMNYRAALAIEQFKANPQALFTDLRKMEPPASELLTQSGRDQLLAKIDDNYYAKNLDDWKLRHEYYLRVKSEANSNSENTQHLREQLSLARAKDDYDSIIELTTSILKQEPKDEFSVLTKACAEMKQSDAPNAEKTILNLISNGHSIANRERAYKFLADYYCKHGIANELCLLERWFDELAEIRNVISHEQAANFTARFIKAKLSDSVAKRCHELFSEFASIKSVRVGRMVLPSCPALVYLIFCIEFDSDDGHTETISAIKNRLVVHQEYDIHDADDVWIRNYKISKIVDSKIFERLVDQS